jgi:hypothetical protein
LEQYAILLVRVSIGLFCAISGANELVVAGGTKPVYDTLVKAKIPFPQLTVYFVAGVEFVCVSTPGFPLLLLGGRRQHTVQAQIHCGFGVVVGPSTG